MSTSSKESEKSEKRKRSLKKESSLTGESKRIKSDGSSKVSLSHLDSKSVVNQFYAEDEEVEGRDPKEDLEMFRTTCTDIRNSMEDIKRLKESSKSSAAAEVEEKRVDATLQFAILKKLNRLAHIRCKKVRDATNEAKQRIDKYHLQLQNLLYETMHLEKEITKCLEFKSKDEEIELVSVEDFYKEAPKEISKPDVTKSDVHQQTMSRLDWELEQRKQLSKKLKDSKTNKESLAQELKTKREYLENLQPKLNTVLQSTKPVQEYLDMPFDQVREQHETARHLPHPLYVLYMQTSAYKQACDKDLTIKIEGDLEAAKAVKPYVPQAAEEESDSDQEEQEQEKKSKRRRKTVDLKNIEKKQRVLRKHPLSVALTINCKDGSSLQLTFFYLMTLEIITVNIKLKPGSESLPSCVSGGDLLSPDLLLTDIYPGDNGTSSPNPANQYDLRKLGLKEFTQYISETGRPFLWAQWLSGLQFLGTDSPQVSQSSLSSTRVPQSAVSSAHMQQTIKRLRDRIQSRLSLLKQLASFERMTVLINPEYMSMFPAKIVSKLSSWKRSTYEDFISLPHASAPISSGLAGPSDLYFTAVIERGTAKMTAQVVLTADYPEVVPVFVLSIQWQCERTALNDVHVQEMEEEINVHYDELILGKSHDVILSNQMQRLMMCFDVYLETEGKENEGPMEISKEKIYTRMTRGPNRTKPYKYCPEVGIFTQR
ncbi:hypothetical protein FSP39_004365 [Pinctada imbricata]|uniref:THO complex subunit 5 homolog n=1 Tax=Pinctada imbricata TaxID=66713 RepID=A0AA88XG31_PINIB|nr:hypothetical protein FSP39_004365 [Pinctada imbricata]